MNPGKAGKVEILGLLSPEHRLIFLVCIAVFAVSTDNYKAMFAVFLFLTGGFFLERLKGRYYRLWFGAIVLTWWGTIFSQGIFYAQMPRQVVFTLLPPSFPLLGKITGGIYVFKEGVRYGFIQALRFGMTITAGFWVCFFTEPKNILRGTMVLGLPYTMAFMLMTGLRFIPLIVNEAFTVIQAQKLRGFKPSKSGLISPIRTARIVLTPVLANCIRRGNILSLSVESRGFDPNCSHFLVSGEGEKKIASSTVIFLCVIFVGFVALSKLLYSLYLAGILYIPQLAQIYAFCEKYL